MMNLKALSVLGILMICFLTPLKSFGKSEIFTSGEDWENVLSRKEKFISLYAPMIIFHKYGVPFDKNPEDYIDEVDQVIRANPQIKKEDIANILASSMYRYEPQSRLAFNIMETEFLKGNYNYNRFSPRLLMPLDNETDS